MAVTVNTESPALLTATAATYYTVPTGAVGNVKELLFCNVNASSRTITVYFVPSGGTAQDSNTFISAVSIAANTTVRFPFNTFLAAGATIQALASAATSVAFLPSVLEYT